MSAVTMGILLGQDRRATLGDIANIFATTVLGFLGVFLYVQGGTAGRRAETMRVFITFSIIPVLVVAIRWPTLPYLVIWGSFASAICSTSLMIFRNYTNPNYGFDVVRNTVHEGFGRGSFHTLVVGSLLSFLKRKAPQRSAE